MNEKSNLQYYIEEEPEYYEYSNQKQSLGFTYENILDNLNVRISNGILYNKNQQKQNQNQKQQSQNQKYTQKQQQNQNQKYTETTNNYQDKNSYIHNKFFNSKSQIEPEIKILRPKNIEEYKQMVLLQSIENHNRRVHLNNTKSKKLSFCHDHIQIRNNKSHQQPINTLFTLKK